MSKGSKPLSARIPARESASIVLLPDAGPLITLAYADALDVLFKPGWSVHIVDMVLHEVSRNLTPTSEKIQRWVAANKLPILPTQTFKRYNKTLGKGALQIKKSNLGELAIQESMNKLALALPETTGIFLFEDHKIARASFFLPDNCRKISTRAYLLFLEQHGWLGKTSSAADIERTAIRNGRKFSQLRFPPDWWTLK